jgi:hypothetical protein
VGYFVRDRIGAGLSSNPHARLRTPLAIIK